MYKLPNGDASTKNLGVNPYGYRYDKNDDLILYIPYKHSKEITEFIKNTLDLPDGVLPEGPNLSIDKSYRFYVSADSHQSITLQNSGSNVRLGMSVVNIDPSLSTFTLDVFDLRPTVLKLTETAKTQTLEVVSGLPYNIKDVKFISNNLKLSGDPTTDDRVLIADNSRVFTFADPIRSKVEGTLVPSTVAGDQIASYVNAINSIMDYDGGYRIDFVWDAGVAHEAVHRACNNVAIVTGIQPRTRKP